MTDTSLKTHAILVAGGMGKRMGADRPKQLLELMGRTILEWTLAPFAACKDIDGITIVSAKDCMNLIEKKADRFRNDRLDIQVIEGGEERQDSVRNGLASLPDECDIIVIHDAVRPFITSDLITECIRNAGENGAVTVMRPLNETVKEVSDGIVVSTPDRSTLMITQTPQVFRADIIKKAHEKALQDGFTGTDDCMLVERLGTAVHIIEGNDCNIKITTPADLEIAQSIAPLFSSGG